VRENQRRSILPLATSEGWQVCAGAVGCIRMRETFKVTRRQVYMRIRCDRTILEVLRVAVAVEGHAPKKMRKEILVDV